MKRALTFSASFVLGLVACGGDQPPPSTPVQTAPVSSAPAVVIAPASASAQEAPAPPANVPRGDFNRIASELFLPVYWTEDKNKNQTIDPDEVAVIWGVGNASLGDYVASGKFTDKFSAANDQIKARFKDGFKTDGLAPEEAKRRTAVVKELAQGRATLVATDLSNAPDDEKKLVRHIMNAAVAIERLYATQLGVTELKGKIPADDTASQMLFFRAQGPKCEAPLTQNDPACTAVPGGVTGKISGLYPAEVMKKDKFCDELQKSTDKTLMDPFTVVRPTIVPNMAKDPPPGAPKSRENFAVLRSEPYNVAFKDDMEIVAKELDAAAKDLPASEAALKAYLVADAKAFRTNQWWPADEAWAKMNANNSKWYLRIAADETYSEPCSTKALFHVSFGRINLASKKLQDKLDPKKQEMEQAIADVAGAPYKARKVSFKLPDFMDVVLNAGDSRPEFGATIGQSLPNFGPVANQSRGRTVAMINFYTDPDSITAQDQVTSSLLCTETMGMYTRDPEPLLVSTVLHEATHNLGPSAQYKVNGKIDREVFGGGLASMLEELKAQSGALFFIDWLADHNEYKKEDAQKSHVRDLLWSFGHISRGMYDDDGHPKAYSQLAAIQLGILMREGAVTWADKPAANGTDTGCFNVDFGKLPAAVKTMMGEVGHIKGAGDKAKAEELMKKFVDVPKDDKIRTTITTRVLRQPKPSFFYSVKMD